MKSIILLAISVLFVIQTTTAVPAIPCGAANDGRFVDDLVDCSGWHWCSGGLFLNNGTCDGIFLFSEPLQRCAFPEEVTCRPSACAPGDRNIAVEDSCASFISCWRTPPQREDCQGTLLFDPVLGECNAPHAVNCTVNVCIGQIDGYSVRDAANCSIFHTCVGGQMTDERHCENNLHFNEANQQCDYPENAQCPLDDGGNGNGNGNGTGPPANDPAPLVQCPPSSHGLQIAHPHDCNLFFVCSANNVPIPDNCPSGLHFSTARQGCDLPTLAGCVATPAPASMVPSYSNGL